jgi:hypothetical protein
MGEAVVKYISKSKRQVDLFEYAIKNGIAPLSSIVYLQFSKLLQTGGDPIDATNYAPGYLPPFRLFDYRYALEILDTGIERIELAI